METNDMNKKASIQERAGSFELACKYWGLDPNQLPVVDNLPGKDRRSIIAYYKLTIIIRALNEGWEPDFSDWSQLKYWNWFYIEDYCALAGFAYASTYYAASHTATYFGSRLCFKTRELAAYARENFRDLYFEYLFIDMPKNYGKRTEAYRN
jgi:hypothetical protein